MNENNNGTNSEINNSVDNTLNRTEQSNQFGQMIQSVQVSQMEQPTQPVQNVESSNQFGEMIQNVQTANIEQQPLVEQGPKIEEQSLVEQGPKIEEQSLVEQEPKMEEPKSSEIVRDDNELDNLPQVETVPSVEEKVSVVQENSTEPDVHEEQTQDAETESKKEQSILIEPTPTANPEYVRPNETMTQTTEEIAKDLKKEKKRNIFFSDILPLMVIIIAVLLIKQFVVTPVQVNGDSMYPTLEDGDVMLLNKVGFKLFGLNRFDIVVINHDGTLLIKRVVGLPNENIKVENNKLYINGSLVEQDFISEDNLTNDFETTTGDNCYFVMGDNRDISKDSRELGCFDISAVEGTTSITFYPFNRFGSKK